MIALLLAALLLLAIVQLVSAAGSATRLQENQAVLQDRMRHAERLLGRAIAEAGFSPRPWDPGFAVVGIADGTAAGVSPNGDRLVVRAWSDTNCFDNLNPVRDAAGRPRFYLRENRFDLTGSGQLARACRYGPSADSLVTQVRRQGLVPGVEALRLLFGLDLDGDDDAERWVAADGALQPQRLRAVRAGLVLASPDAVTEAEGRVLSVLGGTLVTPADGRLRQVLELTRAVRSHGG
jgi:Tfp pilus assembly protein PilW